MARIYISSTYQDLAAAREAVYRALRKMRHDVIAMEDYVATDQRPVDKCLADVAECDIYVGIFAWRYGHIPPEQKCSITELEFREAVRCKKTCLLFLLHEEAPWPRKQMDADPERIEALRAELSRDYIVGFFRTADELAREVSVAIADKATSLPPTGAVLRGSGAIAQGEGAKAVGEKGVLIESKVIHTGTYVESQTVQSQRAETANVASLREAYLNRLFDSTRQLSLAGIDPKAASSEVEARLNLAGVYTALLTQTSEAHEQALQGKSPARESRRQSAVEQLNQHSRLVLLGDPGSGKSTFVNFVMLCLSGALLQNKDIDLSLLTAPLPAEGDDEKARPQPWDHGRLLPVRVILRDFAARGLPDAPEEGTAKHLWQFIESELQSATLEKYAPFLQRELREKGGILLLDGLDEVPEAEHRRVQIKDAVTDFASGFPLCRILVTSRTYAYQKQDWRLYEFPETVLAPFTPAQIAVFVEHWYDEAAVKRGMDPDDARGRAKLLKHAIQESDRLQALAERPLLLTLMASLHAWRGGSLPEKREQLYSDTVDVLLDLWEKPKAVRDASGGFKILQPSLAEWLKVDRGKVREMLNKLAFEAHASQPDLVGTADIPEEKLVAGMLNMSKNPEVKPGRLVEYLSTRAGLLVQRGKGVYAFPHRTFQEYLAACQLTEYDYPDKLVELYRQEPNRWREAALLACAKAYGGAASTIWQLVDELSHVKPPQKKMTPERAWDVHLAAQALTEIADLSNLTDAKKAKVSHVADRLVQVIRCNEFPAIERAAAGANLARLGDPRDEVKNIERMAFCYVPAGKFVMGSDKSRDPKAYNDEMPQHEPALPGYWISRFPVTNAQFELFCQAEGYSRKEYWHEAKKAKVWKGGRVKAGNDDDWRDRPADFGDSLRLPNHPVVGITWYEALAFVRWLNDACHLERPRLRAVLPSEAQWEKAARGGSQYPEHPVYGELTNLPQPVDCLLVAHPNPGQIHPWGQEKGVDTANPNLANYGETNINSTSAVGCFCGGRSPYGCEEMLGNVWEWTRSQWGEDIFKCSFGYPYESDDGREGIAVDAQTLRVVRGGAFFSNPNLVRCAYRYRFNPNARSYNIGFRVALAHSSDL